MATKKKNKPGSKKSGLLKKIIISFIVISLGSSLGGAWITWKFLWRSNIKNVPAGKDFYFYIKTGSRFEDVMVDLRKSGILENEAAFEWVAKWKKYTEKVRPGRYLIKPDMGNNELVNLLRSGKQEPLRLVLNSFRRITLRSL
jgi:UPF0755 protein